ncbi:SDR family oxidoreductase [Verminephrobacter aporrectodeae subsp. tuberculatae]|nr:SDR family oxidoreductase [Verminephrobacter aporrectodeae subsp. tuberculatae]MCW8201856.1 SDR family oxidoreductase [Verminephrobacter aporrectodeae subsp. tuberculatae]
MSQYLITGATGNVGSEVLRQLCATGHKPLAMTRDAKSAGAKLPAGVTPVEADYNDPTSLDAAMRGMDAVVLISPAHRDMVQHQRAVLDASKRAGIRDVVKLSGLGADLQAAIRLPQHHAQIEAHANTLGIRLTPVRPNLFMQVLLGNAASIVAQGKIYAPAADGKISFTDVGDIAAVIVAILADDTLKGRAHDISGPQALSYADAATKIGDAVGYPVMHVDVPEDTARQAMRDAGMDHWLVEAFLELFQIYRAGYGAGIFSANIENILKRPATSFDAFAQTCKQAFVRAA